jgi:hypothetical protein
LTDSGKRKKNIVLLRKMKIKDNNNLTLESVLVNPEITKENFHFEI